MSNADFANALGISPTDAVALLDGRLPITVDLASKLSRGIGASARFWLTREAEYVEDQLRVLAANWSSALPVTQMSQFGWIDRPSTWRERIEACLTFFGVDDFEEWREQYGTQVARAHYRKSSTFENDENATLVWFRAGERAAENCGELPPFDARRLHDLLPEMKLLTRRSDPVQFIPELQRICAQAGLYVGVVRAPSGCRASGATRWLGDRPIVQLSARHRSDDHFWFTFFHEIGHVLFHAAKDRSFIDLDPSPGDEDDPFEDEADAFAQSILIGHATVQIPGTTPREIVRMASHLGISPGILVGQLQHAGRLAPDRMNQLKRRYRWEATTLVAN